MKFLDKFALKIFSIIILIISIITIFVIIGILPLSVVTAKLVFLTDFGSNIKIALAIAFIFVLLSLKGLFFSGKTNDEGKEGIILENNSGKLLISKESLQNLIASVVKEIPGAESISSKTILDRNKNLIVYVTTIVSRDVMIKDISVELQDKIKETLKKTADLEVKEVNVRIKNITSKKVKGLPEPESNEIQTEDKEKNEENKEAGEE